MKLKLEPSGDAGSFHYLLDSDLTWTLITFIISCALRLGFATGLSVVVWLVPFMSSTVYCVLAILVLAANVTKNREHEKPWNSYYLDPSFGTNALNVLDAMNGGEWGKENN